MKEEVINMETNKIYFQDCLIGMKKLPNESVNCILTDPPYKYLKNQKLEVDFNETLFFNEVKRVLKPDGFIIFFGRGISMCRWAVILDDLGFAFKEEIVWDKLRITSPVLALGRRHELIFCFTKKNGKVNNVKIDFFEKYEFEPEKIERTIDRLATTFGNRETFKLLKDYYQFGYKKYTQSKESAYNVTRAKNSNINMNRTIVFAVGLEEGVKEQSIIKQVSDHYNTIHPTQKPVKLLERLLALVSKEGDLVVDPFSGSGSTAVACINTNRNFIGYEIDSEYYNLANNRIQNYLSERSKIVSQTELFKEAI